VALFHGRALLWVLGVTAWWLLLIGVIALMAPAPAKVVGAALVPGRTVYLHTPNGSEWPIPVDRPASHDCNGAFEVTGEGNEGGPSAALLQAACVVVSNRQAVQLVAVDGDVVQVEVMGGPESGRRGWLLTRHIIPYP
jgi:hypothetical protein